VFVFYAPEFQNVLSCGILWQLGVKTESDDSNFAVADGGHHLQGGQSDTQQREQEFVKLLAARALKALAAQSPPWSAPRAGELEFCLFNL